MMKGKLNIQQIRTQFQKIKQQILQQKLSTITLPRIKTQQEKVLKLLQDMSEQNSYDEYDEVVNIQQIYKEMKSIIEENKNTQTTDKLYCKKLKNLYFSFKESSVRGYEVFASSNNNSSQTNPFDIQMPARQHNTQENFFKKKQKEIMSKDSSFKQILQIKDYKIDKQNRSSIRLANMSKSSIKRKQQKQQYLKRIIDEHKKMVNSLQYKVKSEEQLNQFEKNLLKQQKNRYLQKIQEMQTQIQQLYRDNFRLKQLQKTKQHETFSMTNQINKSKDYHGYQPYILKTQSNDLNKINQKNFKKSQEKNQVRKKVEKSPQKEDYLGYKLENEKPVTAKSFFHKNNKVGLNQEQHFGSNILKYLEEDQLPVKQRQQKDTKVGFGMPKPNNFPKDEQKIIVSKKNSFRQENSRNISYGSINQGSRFDTFQMANTLSYVHDSVLNQSRQGVRMNGEVSTRNKVAFFKSSLVLIRQQNIQIAYKRSDLNQKMDKIRLIFYINNKTNSPKKVKIIYQYQQQYFSISVIQKLRHLDANSQGRQVIQVQLISKTDLNGVTDLHIQIDNEIYDLWLPVNFIRFKTTNHYRMVQNQTQMTVVPDRQFSSFENIKQVLPFMYGGKDQFQEWIYLYGQSKFGNNSIKLTWKQNQLLVECNQKWIDFIGFVFHFFK